MTTHLQLAMGRRSLILLCFLVASNAFGNNTGTIAFPGAEGYGRFAQGGRGGDVYAVTNLLDDGKVRIVTTTPDYGDHASFMETLRESIEAIMPRLIVFGVSCI